MHHCTSHKYASVICTPGSVHIVWCVFVCVHARIQMHTHAHNVPVVCWVIWASLTGICECDDFRYLYVRDRSQSLSNACMHGRRKTHLHWWVLELLLILLPPVTTPTPTTPTTATSKAKDSPALMSSRSSPHSLHVRHAQFCAVFAAE